jgi:hypothetical protein
MFWDVKCLVFASCCYLFGRPSSQSLSPVRGKFFLYPPNVQTISGVQPTSYPIGIWGAIPGDKAATT